MLSVLELYREYEKMTSQNFLWNINTPKIIFKSCRIYQFCSQIEKLLPFYFLMRKQTDVIQSILIANCHLPAQPQAILASSIQEFLAFRVTCTFHTGYWSELCRHSMDTFKLGAFEGCVQNTDLCSTCNKLNSDGIPAKFLTLLSNQRLNP